MKTLCKPQSHWDYIYISKPSVSHKVTGIIYISKLSVSHKVTAWIIYLKRSDCSKALNDDKYFKISGIPRLTIVQLFLYLIKSNQHILIAKFTVANFTATPSVTFLVLDHWYLL